MESMENIGFSSGEIDQVLTLLAAVLHLGDIVSGHLLLVGRLLYMNGAMSQ